MLSLRVVLPVVSVLAVLLSWRPPAVIASPEVTARARDFVDAHTRRLRPLEIEANLAWWEANTTGSEDDFDRKKKAQNKIDKALADRDVFAEVKELSDESKDIDDAHPAPGHRTCST